jgi:small subunit ribosomal protein S28e
MAEKDIKEKKAETANVEKAPKQDKKDTTSGSVEEVTKTKKKSRVEVSDASPAQVVKVFKKVGLYGECYQVLARVLEGNDKGNLLRRNVRGPVRENDLLMLKETERDVRAV